MGRFQKPPGLAIPYDMTAEEFESFSGVEMQAEKHDQSQSVFEMRSSL